MRNKDYDRFGKLSVYDARRPTWDMRGEPEGQIQVKMNRKGKRVIHICRRTDPCPCGVVNRDVEIEVYGVDKHGQKTVTKRLVAMPLEYRDCCENGKNFSRTTQESD